MEHPPFATALFLQLLSASADCPKPARCPYCRADTPPHWKIHGEYSRYAGDLKDPSKRISVVCYRCRITGRTFSLPPDSLLPYCRTRTSDVLRWLYTLLIEGVALNTLAHEVGVPRSTLRSLRAIFLRTLAKLRLPWHEGALDAARFLTALARKKAAAVVDLFRGWKEGEPKLSIVGIYAR